MITVFPLKFLGQGACLQPENQRLHDLTVNYVQRELLNGQDVNLSLLNQVFVAAEADEDDNPLTVHGVAGANLRIDIPLFRATTNEATVKLSRRLHSHLADIGYLGQEVFIHLSNKELPEQRCSGYDEAIALAKLKPADRFLVRVRSV